MGKKREKYLQQVAYHRGYSDAMKEMNKELDKVINHVYNIRLSLETSPSISTGKTLRMLGKLQGRVEDLSDKVTASHVNNGRPSILDLHAGINIVSEDDDDPMGIIDDSVVDYMIDKELEERD